MPQRLIAALDFFGRGEVATLLGEMMVEISMLVVAVFGTFLITLGVVAFVRPQKFRKFLLGFAQNARVHFIEMGCRLLVGLAFLASAPGLRFESVFLAFGWLLIVTTLVLVMVPWRIHLKFAQLVVPRALEYASFMGAVSCLLGIGVFFGLFSDGKI